MEPIALLQQPYVRFTDPTIFVLTSLISAIGIFAWVSAYLIRRRIEAFEKHMEDCRVRVESGGRVEERLKAMEYEVKSLRTTTHYIANYVAVIGAKLEVDPPPKFKEN